MAPHLINDVVITVIVAIPLLYILALMFLPLWRRRSKTTSRLTKVVIVMIASYILIIGTFMQLIAPDSFPYYIVIALAACLFTGWFTWRIVEVDTRNWLKKRQEMRERVAHQEQQISKM